MGSTGEARSAQTGPVPREEGADAEGNSLVFPLSDWAIPSISGYTGTTVTVYSVPGSRFWRTMEVVLPGTCSCSENRPGVNSGIGGGGPMTV